MTSKLIAIVLIVCTSIAVAEDNLPKPATAKDEHAFLKQFVGQWECESEAFFEPGKPPIKSKASMTGRMIGDFWAVVVVKGEVESHPYLGQGTYGYDSQDKKKFIGTWVDSMSDFLWKYEGSVDGNKLVLNSEGPNPLEPGKMIKARDTWEFKNKDLILLTSQFEGPDGKMATMMKGTCRRKK